MCVCGKKKKEYLIVCELENENEEEFGIENQWIINKRYSDFHDLHQKLKKLNPEFAALIFPSKTYLPGRSTKVQVVEQRKEQLQQYLQSVILWVRNKIENTQNIEEISSILTILNDFMEVNELDRKPPFKKNNTKFSFNLFHSGWCEFLYNQHFNLLFPPGSPKRPAVSASPPRLNKSGSNISGNVRSSLIAPHLQLQNENEIQLKELYFGSSTVNCEVLGYLLSTPQHLPPSNNNLDGSGFQLLDLSLSCGGSLQNEGFRNLLEVLSRGGGRRRGGNGGGGGGSGNGGGNGNGNGNGEGSVGGGGGGGGGNIIKELYIGGYQGHNCDSEDLLSFFKENKNLEKLMITGGISISIDESLLGKSLEINTMKVLDLSRCFKNQIITKEAVTHLSNLLKTHKSIESIYLNENPMGDDGAYLLSASLPECQSLKLLSLKDCKIGPSGLISIFQALNPNNIPAKSSKLEKLVLTDRPSTILPSTLHPPFQKEKEKEKEREEEENEEEQPRSRVPTSSSVCRELAETLRSNKHLVELNLSNQYLGESLHSIPACFSTNNTLKALYLSNNRFSTSGFLNNFLKFNQSVEILDLSHNDLIPTDEDDSSEWKHNDPDIPPPWFELLANDVTLVHFHCPWLDNSNFSNLFIEALSKNTRIKLLQFSSPVYPQKSIEQFFLQNKTVEKIINFESPPTGLFTVHASIVNNTNLNTLVWNNIKTLEARNFIKHFKQSNSTIKYLRFIVQEEENNLEILNLVEDALSNRPA